MLMSDAAYNLQKLLHYTPRRGQTATVALPKPKQVGGFHLYFRSDFELAMGKGW
ncbi:hypothetical protein [Pontibacter mangrovi]|uniref:hypothetical protein n=1 Tax=Pontibacter mangrovi TaxID=2589816 RepID=UPI0015E47C0F|nr:hypothetical protein [Pontibacter mangrovi]